MRSQESDGHKKTKGWEESNGFVKVVTKAVPERADMGTDHLLRQAMTRRALALDMCDLASLELVESWHTLLFRAMNEPPPQGYCHVTLEQLRNADRKLWHFISDQCRGGVQKPAWGHSSC